MIPGRPRSRWRAGVRATLYLVAIVIIAGGVLVAVGILFLLAMGVLLTGGILAVFIGLLLFGLWRSERRGEREPR